jgi:excisionase family DNA binding protein
MNLQRTTEEQKPLMVTYRQAAELLGVCERSVWKLVDENELKAVRIGRSVRIPVVELERFINERSAAA